LSGLPDAGHGPQPAGPHGSFDLTIDSLAYQGAGVGRYGGKVVFVPFTAPGDRVRVRPVADHGSYMRAELLEVLLPSPGRVEPPCPHFGVCGGCQWQHVAYPQQLEAKRAIVADALRRIGGADAEIRSVIPSPLPYGYRSRVRFHLDARGRVGFYRRATHEVIEIERCPLLDERLNGAVPGLHGRRGPAAIELRVGDDGEVGPADGLPFGQVNAAVNALLMGCLKARVAAAFGPGSRLAILDLYCGDGNLSLPLATAGRSIVGYDLSRSAVAAARARTLAIRRRSGPAPRAD